MNARTAPAWLTAREFAHRGLHSPGVPENSLAAAEAAIAAGMGIECDIQRSRDHHPVVFHDWDLARLTGRDGMTDSLVAEDLERLILLGSDHTPMRLSRYLDRVAGRSPVLLEIKSLPGYDVDFTCLCVLDALANYAGDHAIMSFDSRVIGWFRDHSPKTVRGLVCTDTLENGFRGAWRALDEQDRELADFLAVDIRDLPDPLAHSWREKGRPLLTWTVRTPQLRERAIRHADALISEGEGLA